MVYRYINRGLFERDKLTYLLMNCLKILLISGRLSQIDVDLLLKSGAGLDLKAEKPNPYAKFISNDVWLNII